MYKLLAISKTKHGSIYYAVIDEFAVVVAVIRVYDGWCYDMKFLESSPSEIKQVVEWIKDKERKHML